MRYKKTLTECYINDEWVEYSLYAVNEWAYLNVENKEYLGSSYLRRVDGITLANRTLFHYWRWLNAERKDKMKRVLVRNTEKEEQVIDLCDLDINKAVIAKNHQGEIIGMVIYEDRGYITRRFGGSSCSGHYPTLQECVKRDSQYYTFYVE